ncbi:uncharacterized protein LOC144881143 [Branchiostoma floridae x Branchiostoma japonicum]
MAERGRSLRHFTTLVLFVCLFTGCTSCRRRRGGCACTWNSWGSWSSCSEPCGNTGTRTRTRTGSCCATAGTETAACNRFCYNSGTPSGNGCICTSQYQGRCCDVDKLQGDEGGKVNGSSDIQQGGTVSVWVYVGGGGRGFIILLVVIIICVCCKCCGLIHRHKDVKIH